MKRSNFALRLQPSLMEEARKLASAEGIAVNQLINVAVAEKVSALRTEEYFAERAARGNVSKALRILERAGVGKPPVAGDELPKKVVRRMQMAQDVTALDRDIRFAIANKRLVEMFYESKRRVVEPHDYGIQKGAAKLLVYQVGGESSSRIPGWKHLDVTKIEWLVVLDEAFPGSRGATHRYHKSWDVLFARVA